MESFGEVAITVVLGVLQVMGAAAVALVFLNFSGSLPSEGAFVLAGALAVAWVRTPSSARAAVGVIALVAGTWWIRSTPEERAGVLGAVVGRPVGVAPPQDSSTRFAGEAR